MTEGFLPDIDIHEGHYAWRGTPCFVGGIDPSLNGSGLFWGPTGAGTTIKGYSHQGDARLLKIEAEVSLYLNTHRPFVMIEDLPISARAGGITGMVQGVVRAAMMRRGIEYLAIPAATLKKAATNNGRAEKADMINGYRDAYPEARISDDNQADAAWLAECGKALLGLPHKLACPLALNKYVDKLPPVAAGIREEVLASRI